MSQRIGVLGGAFDPPHLAHRLLAETAMRDLRLDQLRVYPTGQAWHKSSTLSSPEHRLAMTRIAFSDMPQIMIDDAEMRREGPTYTLDTLRQLRQDCPDAALFLIIGADQARAFERWHGWQDILHLAVLAVAERGGDPGQWHNPHLGAVERLQMPLSTLSATDVRQRCRSGLPIRALVTAPVADYIEQHGLYAAHP